MNNTMMWKADWICTLCNKPIGAPYTMMGDCMIIPKPGIDPKTVDAYTIPPEDIAAKIHLKCYEDNRQKRWIIIKNKMREHINGPYAYPTSEKQINCHWCGRLIGYVPESSYQHPTTCPTCKNGSWYGKPPDLHIVT